MKNLLGMSADEMSAVFTEWNKGELDSFLIEITANIMAYKVGRALCCHSDVYSVHMRLYSLAAVLDV